MKGNRKIKNNLTGRKNHMTGLVSKVRYSAFIAFPVIALAAFIYFISISIGQTFHVERFVFTGNEHLSDEELKNLAGFTGNENLLTISNNKIFEKMIGSPWIRSVSIRKELPDSLHILIKEAEPFALFDLKGRLFIVDEKGKMLEELKDTSVPFLPVITGTPFGKKEVFSEALNLVRAIKDKGLLFEKEHIEIIAYKPQEMSVNLDGVVVKVGAGDYEDKLDRLIELEGEIKKRNIHVDYIDLRFANKAVVKPVNEVIN